MRHSFTYLQTAELRDTDAALILPYRDLTGVFVCSLFFALAVVPWSKYQQFLQFRGDSGTFDVLSGCSKYLKFST